MHLAKGLQNTGSKYGLNRKGDRSTIITGDFNTFLAVTYFLYYKTHLRFRGGK